MTLGPRVLKTGLAVTLALYICSYLGLEPAVFAGVAAIFTIQPSIYRSWKNTTDQLQTNILGAMIALVGLYFFGHNPFTIGMVIIIVIMISLKLKMESTISLTLVTVLAIMSAPGQDDWLFALNRFSTILIGMGSALLVNIIVLPPNYKTNYMDKMEEVFQNLSLLLRTAISNELTESSFQKDWKRLKGDIKKLEELYKIFDEEREKISKVKPVNAREIIVYKQMLKSLQLGEELLEIIDEHYFQSHPTDREDRVFDAQIEHLIKAHEQLLLKYEGKVKAGELNKEETIIEETSLFLQQILPKYQKNESEKLRLVVVGSAIFQYAFQLQRLSNIIENFQKHSHLEVKKSRFRFRRK